MDGHAETWPHKLSLKRKPSDQFRQQCYISMDPDDVCAPGLLRDVGLDNVVWASDYPHTDHDFPGAVKETLEILLHAPAGAAEKVLDSNPRRLYGLPGKP